MLRFSGQDSIVSQKRGHVVAGRRPAARGWSTIAGDAKASTGAARASAIALDEVHSSSSCSGHGGAELLRGDGLRVEGADQPAAQQHPDRVGEADQLVEVGGDQQHRQARSCGPA